MIPVNSLPYEIALLAVRVIGLLVILTIAGTTRIFVDTPAFDVSDIGSVLVVAIHNDSVVHDTKQNISTLKGWSGDSGDRSLRNTRLMFDCSLRLSGAPFAFVM